MTRGARHPWVDVDGRAGVVLAVDHLVERGHERIAWVGWQKGSYIGEDRRSGWADRMHEHGLSTSRLSARGDDTLDFGRRAAHALLDVEQPTAFVCASDTLAMGVLRALHERDLRPGRDVVGGRLRRLAGRPGLLARADVGAAAAGAGRGRDRPAASATCSHTDRIDRARASPSRPTLSVRATT